MILSKSSSKVNFSRRPPSARNLYSGFVHVLNFSKIYAANATGEAATAVPLKIYFPITVYNSLNWQTLKSLKSYIFKCF